MLHARRRGAAKSNILAGKNPTALRTETPCGRALFCGIRVLLLPESAPASMAPSAWALMPPSGEGGRGTREKPQSFIQLRDGRVSPAPPS